jgi:hypothetical protein
VNSLWAGAANLSGANFIPSFDLGAMVWGWLGPRDLLEYYVGIFDGDYRNQITNQDGNFMYAARVVVNPIGRPSSFQESYVGMRRPSIQVGLNIVYQDRQIGFVQLPGSSMQTANVEHLTYAGADLAAFGYGFSLYGELYYRNQRETDQGAAPSTESLGWLVQAGYMIPAPFLRDHLEVVARVQDFDPSDCFFHARNPDPTSPNNCDIRWPASQTAEIYRDFMWTTAITFGLNWYQLGHGLKAQASYTINRENRGVGTSTGVNDPDPRTGIVDNDVFLVQLTGSF